MSTHVAGFEPHWTGPPHVRLFVTTRGGGHSRPPFDGFNLIGYLPDDIHIISLAEIGDTFEQFFPFHSWLLFV
mgnify:CR=1 FL=1